jgi:hypothetical protein
MRWPSGTPRSAATTTTTHFFSAYPSATKSPPARTTASTGASLDQAPGLSASAAAAEAAPNVSTAQPSAGSAATTCADHGTRLHLAPLRDRGISADGEHHRTARGSIRRALDLAGRRGPPEPNGQQPATVSLPCSGDSAVVHELMSRIRISRAESPSSSHRHLDGFRVGDLETRLPCVRLNEAGQHVRVRGLIGSTQPARVRDSHVGVHGDVERAGCCCIAHTAERTSAVRAGTRRTWSARGGRTGNAPHHHRRAPPWRATAPGTAASGAVCEIDSLSSLGPTAEVSAAVARVFAATEPRMCGKWYQARRSRRLRVQLPAPASSTTSHSGWTDLATNERCPGSA